jgi:glycosyltransferase involved in cell wall biosynthesis
MPRLIFLNRFFFPDHSATSQILGDLAFHLAEARWEVHVVASRQLYDDPGAQLPKEETIRGVRVHRIAGTRFGRKGLAGRALDYLSYFVSSYLQVLKLARAGDIVIAKTDPPLLSIIATLAARQKRALLVNWLQDLYPEVATQLGVPHLEGPIVRILRRLRDWSLSSAAANVVVGKNMAAKVAACGAPVSTIEVIPNWCADDAIVPVPPDENPLRRAWDLQSRFVVGYSGNLGRAHEFETILAAAEHLRDDSRIVFLFIGGGHSFDELRRRVEELKLQRMFRFLPYQARADLKYSLGVPDVHLLSLRPEVEGLIVPSKFYGIAAAGRPIVAVIARDGEFAGSIEKWTCGLVIEPGRGEDLSRAISELSVDHERCATMGRRAREMLEAEFTRRRAFDRWDSVLARARTDRGARQP